jgi:hypothetical protein
VKRFLVTGLTLLALAVIACAGGWYFVAQRVQGAIDAWMQDEKLRDRSWVCSNRIASGFPFTVRIECAGPSFRSEYGPVRSANVRSLVGEAHAFNPFRIAFSVQSPMKVMTPTGSMTLVWESFGGTLDTRDKSPDLAARLQALRVDESSGDVSNWAQLRAGDLSFRLQKSPDRAPEADARLVTVSIENVSKPSLDDFFQNRDPLRANLSAVILKAGAATTGSFAERLDRWAEAGGRIQIGTLTAGKGASQMNASGDLTVDDQRRPSGRLSVRLAGVGPLLSRFKLPAAPMAIEGLLRGSGNRSGSNLLENRTLPFELRNGRLFIGPLRTPIAIPPLI